MSRSYEGRGQSYEGANSNDRFSDDRHQEDRDVVNNPLNLQDALYQSPAGSSN